MDCRPRYLDHDSGAKANRAELRPMFAAAEKQKFDVLLFWALDRLSREGTLVTLQYLNRLSRHGVGPLVHGSVPRLVWRLHGVFKDAVIAILAAIARQERLRLSERAKAALKGEGEGHTIWATGRQTASKLKVGVTTVKRVCERTKDEDRNPG